LVTESRKRSSELYYSLNEANNVECVVSPIGSSNVSLPSHPISTTPIPSSQLYSHVYKKSRGKKPFFCILAVLLALVLILVYFLIGHVKSDPNKVSSKKTTKSSDSITPLTTNSSNLRFIFSYLSTHIQLGDRIFVTPHRNIPFAALKNTAKSTKNAIFILKHLGFLMLICDIKSARTILFTV
jgi:hypothetical protein